MAVGCDIVESGGVEGRETCQGLGRSAPAEGTASPESMREELEIWLKQGEHRAEW